MVVFTFLIRSFICRPQLTVRPSAAVWSSGPVDQPETICIGRGGWVMGLKFTVLYRSFREQSSHKCSYFSASFRNQRGLLGDLNNLAHNGAETGTRARVRMMGQVKTLS